MSVPRLHIKNNKIYVPSGFARALFYIISFIFPLLGFVIGPIFSEEDDERAKSFGRVCFWLAIASLVLLFLSGCLLGFIFSLFGSANI